MQPDDYETRFDVGTALSMQHRYAEAAESYRRGLVGLPNRADIRGNLAADLIQLNDFGRATAELESANRLQPRNPGVLYNLAYLAVTNEHNPAKAKEYLAEALDANPSYQPARQMMDQLSGAGAQPFSNWALKGKRANKFAATRGIRGVACFDKPSTDRLRHRLGCESPVGR